MKKARQLGFEILQGNNIKHFGGDFLKNSHAKEKRPISIKRSMHLVMRSSKAKSELSFLRKDKRIKEVIATQARAFGVKIYRLANGGNHLHIILLPRSREAFNGFIRAISGLIARLVLGVERGKAKRLKFWDKRPFTRIVEWGRGFKTVSNYLLQNTLEALGFIPYQPRKYRPKPFNSTA
jgi:REP element-mobilizing transposase RayT